MKLKFLVMAMLAALTACKPFTGKLEVKQPTEFVLKKTILGNLKKATIKPGNYTTELNFKSKNKAQLIVNANKKYKIKLKLPEGDSLPRYYGNISYSAREIEQPWDLKGFVDSKETYSDDFSAAEVCSYTIRRRVCRMVTEGREGHGFENKRERRRRECKMKNVTVYGHQRVTYHFKYTDSKVNLSLLKPGSNVLLSRFSGARHESDKIYTYQSVCR